MKNKLANLGFALSRNAQKKLIGGNMDDPGEGGACVGCVCGSMSSCWYTNGSAAELCARVSLIVLILLVLELFHVMDVT